MEEMEITWPLTLRVWWAYAWRNLICIGVAAIICGIVGGVVGAVLTLARVEPGAIRLITTALAMIVGLGVSLIPMRLILGNDFGRFRLVLVRKSAELPLTSAVPASSPTGTAAS